MMEQLKIPSDLEDDDEYYGEERLDDEGDEFD